MICTIDDIRKAYPDLTATDEQIQDAANTASAFIEKVTGKAFEEPLPYHHPLNLACRKIAWYELHPDKKERLGVEEERLEGYSYTRAKTPVIYGDPEVDRILALYIEGVRVGAG